MESKDLIRAMAYLDEGSGGGGGGGVERYAQLPDKPQINGKILEGNKTSASLGMYDKNEVDTLLAAKADAGDVYTKTETDDLLSEKLGVNLEVGVEKWYGTYTEDGVTYQVYSKVVKIDALPAAAGITNYPHGITGIKQILSAYGFTTDGFVLNAPRQNAQDNIAIYQVSKNNTTGSIAIEVGKDRSSKQAYVCVIYAKNN